VLHPGALARFVLSFVVLAVVYVLALYADVLWLCALTGASLAVLYALFVVSFTRTWRWYRALRRRAVTLRSLQGGGQR
jgi:hypothetical protein